MNIHQSKFLTEYEREFAEKLFYSPKEIDRPGGLWPLRAGQNQAKDNYISGPKLNDRYSIHFVLSGKLLFQQQTNSTELGPGDVFFMLPNMTYMYKILPSDKPLRMIWLVFDGPHMQGLLLDKLLFESNLPCLRHIVDASMEQKLYLLLQEFRTIEQTGSYLRLIGMFYLLLGQLTADVPEERTTRPFAWVQRSVDFIRDHYMQNIQIQDVARAAGVERSHFSTVFTEQMGISPSKYMRRLRMEKAAQMLKDTRHTITEIALSVGYADLFPFTRAFTQYYGTSPSDYRR